jgi:hypothetical protein
MGWYLCKIQDCSDTGIRKLLRMKPPGATEKVAGIMQKTDYPL